MKLGIDVGNGFVKYVGGKFPSNIDTGVLDDLSGEGHSVVYEGNNLIVGGARGVQVIGKEKYFDKNYLILLLTAIVLSNKKAKSPIEADVVIGVPANYYSKDFRARIKGELQGKHEEITVDGEDYLIVISNIEVFIEGCVPIKDNDESSMLVIDMGSGTIDIVQWDKMKKVYDSTFGKAFTSLYNAMIRRFDKEEHIRLSLNEVESFVGLTEVELQEKVYKTPYFKTLLENLISECANAIKNDGFNYETCNKVVLIGGGAEATLNYWKKHFPNIKTLKDSQYINQQVYEIVARRVFHEKE